MDSGGKGTSTDEDLDHVPGFESGESSDSEFVLDIGHGPVAQADLLDVVDKVMAELLDIAGSPIPSSSASSEDATSEPSLEVVAAEFGSQDATIPEADTRSGTSTDDDFDITKFPDAVFKHPRPSTTTFSESSSDPQGTTTEGTSMDSAEEAEEPDHDVDPQSDVPIEHAAIPVEHAPSGLASDVNAPRVVVHGNRASPVTTPAMTADLTAAKPGLALHIKVFLRWLCQCFMEPPRE